MPRKIPPLTGKYTLVERKLFPKINSPLKIPPGCPPFLAKNIRMLPNNK